MKTMDKFKCFQQHKISCKRSTNNETSFKNYRDFVLPIEDADKHLDHQFHPVIDE